MSDRHPDTVAVLIPVFNDAGTLASTLRSLDDEEVPVLIVVVDDGSATPISNVSSHSRHEVVVVRQLVNRGIERALNTGLELIRSEGVAYVARLDSGDRSLPGRLTRQQRFLAANPDVAVVGAGVEWRDDNGRSRFTRTFPTAHRAIVRMMHHSTALIHPAVMFRTDVVNALGNYSVDYPAAEDFDLFWRIARRHRVANLPDVLVITRFDPAGLSMQRRRRQLASTLRIQIANFDFLSWASYYGVLKTLGRFVIPYGWIVALKRARSAHHVAVTA